MPVESQPRSPGGDGGLGDGYDDPYGDDEQGERFDQGSLSQTSPRYISSAVSLNSPPRSRNAGSLPSQQQEQQPSPMRSTTLRFKSDHSRLQGPQGSSPSSRAPATLSARSSGTPLDRGMSRAMLSQQGSWAAAQRPQGRRILSAPSGMSFSRGLSRGAGPRGSRALQEQASGAGLVRGRSRGLGTRERLWGAAEGSGVWPLRDAQAAHEAPGDTMAPPSDVRVIDGMWPLRDAQAAHEPPGDTMAPHPDLCMVDGM